MKVVSHNFVSDKTSKEYKNTEAKKAVWELIRKRFGRSGKLKKIIL